MGRKLRGAKLRAHKRGKEHAIEIVKEQAHQVETSEVVNKKNEELFVIDTQGDAKAQVPPHFKQLPSKKEVAKSKSKVPQLEQQRINDLVKKHDAAALQKMAKAGQAQLRGHRNKKRKNFDLWQDDDDSKQNDNSQALVSADNDQKKKPKVVVSAKQDLKSSNAKAFAVSKVGGVKSEHTVTVAEPISKKAGNEIAVEVAKAGQSYRPDPQGYAKAMEAAVGVELRRDQAEHYKKTPLSTGMAPETRALLIEDSSSDEDSDNESDQEDDTNIAIRKRPEKLTRAERNKQKRLRQEKAMQDKQRQTKKLLNSVAEIPRFKKELKREAKQRQEQKEIANQQKEARKATPGKQVLERLSQKDPLHAPTFPLALPSEHADSSLRTLKPKGSLVTDRMASFVDRNLVSKRKMGDKKRIVQGKRRKVKITGKGHEIAKEMDWALMG